VIAFVLLQRHISARAYFRTVEQPYQSQAPIRLNTPAYRVATARLFPVIKWGTTCESAETSKLVYDNLIHPENCVILESASSKQVLGCFRYWRPSVQNTQVCLKVETGAWHIVFWVDLGADGAEAEPDRWAVNPADGVMSTRPTWGEQSKVSGWTLQISLNIMMQIQLDGRANMFINDVGSGTRIN
jgi:hypothetical protein